MSECPWPPSKDAIVPREQTTRHIAHDSPMAVMRNGRVRRDGDNRGPQGVPHNKRAHIRDNIDAMPAKHEQRNDLIKIVSIFYRFGGIETTPGRV